MYLDYWQLTTQPFEAVTDRGALYPCEAHEGALSKLRYAIENRRGAAALAGPAGVGKTMLVQMLRGSLGERWSPFVHVVFPQMSGPELLAYVAEQFGAPPADAPRHTVDESIRRIEFVLRQNADHGRHAVVAVDEAHLLEDCGTLETLRLLLNFESAGRPTLTLLLVGQMGLIPALGRLPSLDERVSVKTLLRSLTAAETAAYVRHRLAAAGAQREPFTADALRALHELSHGIPRQINRLADLALVVGFAERLPQISAQDIEAVSDELVSLAA